MNAFVTDLKLWLLQISFVVTTRENTVRRRAAISYNHSLTLFQFLYGYTYRFPDPTEALNRLWNALNRLRLRLIFPTLAFNTPIISYFLIKWGLIKKQKHGRYLLIFRFFLNFYGKKSTRRLEISILEIHKTYGVKQVKEKAKDRLSFALSSKG